jgi:hypothetical protein
MNILYAYILLGVLEYVLFTAVHVLIMERMNIMASMNKTLGILFCHW